MALCKNSRCMAPLTEYQWGGGYCSQRCMATADDYERDSCAPLMDPSDPTGHAEICRDRDEVDAMLEAYNVHPALPKALYLLKKRGKKNMAAVAREIHVPYTTLVNAYNRFKQSTSVQHAKAHSMSWPIAKDQHKRKYAAAICATGDVP